MRALIVDDSRILRVQLAETLADAGFELFDAENSSDALDLLDERGAVDLIVVNWDLPEAGGLRFVLGLRSSVRYGAPRLLMMIEHPTTEAVLDAVQLGVDDCLIKPLSAQKLLEKLTDLRLGNA